MFTSKSFTTPTTLLVAMAIFATALTEAQSPMPAPTYAPRGETVGAPGPAGPDCMTALFSLSDCLSFVEEGSNLTVPDKACCPELSNLVDTQPICLCQLLGSGVSNLGIAIDMSKALSLPSSCGVSTPDPSLCAMVGVPVSLPSSPSEAPGSSVDLAPGSGGEVLAPSSTNPSSGASSIEISGLSTFMCLAIGSFGAFLMI